MVTIDWVFLITCAAALLLGLLFGAGKLLPFLLKGIKGVVLSVFVCFLIFGLVLNLPFVQHLLALFRDKYSSGNAFVRFLFLIRIDLVVFAVALFIVVQIARILALSILRRILEIDNFFMRVINKSLGVVLCVFWLGCIGLFVLQLMYYGAGAGAPTPEGIAGSVFKLDAVYRHNPMTALVHV